MIEFRTELAPQNSKITAQQQEIKNQQLEIDNIKNQQNELSQWMMDSQLDQPNLADWEAENSLDLDFSFANMFPSNISSQSDTEDQEEQNDQDEKLEQSYS